MSTNYVAWNGQSYPCPPPDGWYEGSDGRWWAPGSGPEAASTAPSTTDAKHNEPPERSEIVPDRDLAMGQDAWAAPDQGASIDTPPADETPSDGPKEAPVAALSTDTGPGQTADPRQPTYLGPVSTDDGQTTVLTGGAGRTLPNIDESAGDEPPTLPDLHHQLSTDDRSDGSPLVLLVMAGVALFVVVAGGLGFLAVRDDNSNTDTSPTTTAAVDNQAGVPSTTIGSEPRTTLPPTSPPPTTQAPSADGESATTTTISPEVQDRIGIWRANLDGQGVDTSQVTDADVAAFGNAFCVFALVSVDLEEFDTFRDRALDGVAGRLTANQLNTAINTAVLAFCPDEATRLGL